MELMQRIELGELATVLVGLIALFVGRWLRQSVPLLSRLDMPNAVVGAMIVAVLILALQLTAHVDITFGQRTSSFSMKAANSVGVVLTRSIPCDAADCFTSGSAATAR